MDIYEGIPDVIPNVAEPVLFRYDEAIYSILGTSGTWRIYDKDSALIATLQSVQPGTYGITRNADGWSDTGASWQVLVAMVL